MRWKRSLFALLTVTGFFVAVEAALWVAGVEPLIARTDPFQGFSATVRAFEPDPAAGIYRTPPRATRHSFNDQRFAARKPPEGFRLFVLGGSSAYGFPWGAGRAFTRLLGDALQAAWPGRSVEAVNAAAMSYGSHRLRILAGELLDYDPDLLVIYGGHNEFIETRFYREVLERPEELDRIRGWLYRWRLYAAVAGLVERSRADPQAFGTDEADARPGELLGLDVVREYPREVVEEEKATAVSRFEEHLAAILALARDAGVPVVLCTVPSNLGDWAPNHSSFDEAIGPGRRREVVAWVAEAREALARDDPAAAAQLLELATAAAPGHAEVLFRSGESYAALGRWEEARAAFVAARDADAQPSRAPSAINDAIRRLARTDGARLVDVEQLFAQVAPHAIPGFDLFEDYVHPNPEGHRIIARELWNAIRAERMLDGPSYAEEDSFEAALARAGTLDRAADSHAQSPALLFNLAVVLENQGRFEEAIERYREVLRLQPQYYVARANLGRLLARAERHAEAAVEHARVLEEEPGYLRSMLGLAEALRRSRRPEEALVVARRAVAADPAGAAPHRVEGLALAQLQRFEEAADALARSLEIDPAESEARVDLGFCRLYLGQIAEAGEAFRASDPTDTRVRNGLGAVLTEEGRLDDAERLFMESLRLDPADPFARVGLEEIAKRRLDR